MSAKTVAVKIWAIVSRGQTTAYGKESGSARNFGVRWRRRGLRVD
jgi:hypothetical protein